MIVTGRAPSSLRLLGGVLLLTAILATGCGSGSGALGTLPPSSPSAEPSVAQGSPDVTPAPSADGSVSPSVVPSDGTATSSPSPSASGAPVGTTVIRTYFWLGGPDGSAGLVATLRDIPSTKAVATAAVTALLSGPSSTESARSISSQIPDGTQLLGLTIDNGLATIDLSSEFAAGGGTTAYQTRLAQVVYTLTQFPTVKSVTILIEGNGDSVALNRADYVQLLPAIWVDRPAWNAAAGNPIHVTGSADVFEAAFRVAVLDGSGKVLADQQVMATCGTGCRGTFDTSVAYTIAKAQYGTLRVYEPSAQDGSPQNVRDYRVWLTPKS
jgi:germination protein M